MASHAQKKAELELRGTIISISIIFESNLMSIIYASNIEQYKPPFDKRLKLKGCTFDQKIKRTKDVLELYHPDLLVKYDKFFEDITSFKDFRNLFAHCAFEWFDNPKNEFNVWDWTEAEDGFQYYASIRFKLEETLAKGTNFSKEITPSITRLRNEIEVRLKNSHPEFYRILKREDTRH